MALFSFIRHYVFDFSFCIMLGLRVQFLYYIKPVEICTLLELRVYFFFRSMLGLYVHLLLCWAHLLCFM